MEIEPIGKISGFQVHLIEYKFLWFTFYSRHKLRIFPGYFIDKNGDRIILENAIVKNIYRPKRNTWYYTYLHYPDKKITDIIFHDKAGYYENHLRISAVLINNKGRVRPFLQHGSRFTFTNPLVQKLKNLSMPKHCKVITESSGNISEWLSQSKESSCKSSP